MNWRDRVIEKMFYFLNQRFHTSFTDKVIDTVVQFIKFCLIGVTNSLIYYGINVFVLTILKPYELAWDYVAGNVVAFLLSVLWSFYWNNKLVFTLQQGQSRSLLFSLAKTYIAYGFTGILLNNLLSYLWIDVLSVSKYIAPLINLIINVPINYMINKWWAFKSNTSSEKVDN